jgi:hypothetical protein
MAVPAAPTNPMCRNVGNGSVEVSWTPGQGRAANLLTAPESFSDAAWTKTGASIVPNATTDPFGFGTDADRMDTDTGEVSQDFTALATSYAFSFYIKAGTTNLVKVAVGTGGSLALTILSGPGSIAGSYVMNLSTSAWTRVQAVWSGGSAGSRSVKIMGSALSVATAYIWGAKLEVGAAATAYLAPSTADSYNVYLSTSLAGTYSKANIAPITDTKVRLSNIKFGLTVYIKVTAVNSDGEGAQSAAAQDAVCSPGVTTLQFEGLVGDQIPAGAMFTAKVGTRLVSFVTLASGICARAPWTDESGIPWTDESGSPWTT